MFYNRDSIDGFNWTNTKFPITLDTRFISHFLRNREIKLPLFTEQFLQNKT